MASTSAQSRDVRISDGSFVFSGGVDSSRVTTAQTQANSDGLPRNMLSWAINATVRGGGITQRPGIEYLCTVVGGSQLYQGGWLYNPIGDSNPHLMLSISGNIYRVRVDTNNSVQNLTTLQPVDFRGKQIANPPLEPQAYFTQSQEFMVIQAGDFGKPGAPIFVAPNGKAYVGTNPLFYDGVQIWRSKGIFTVAPSNPNNMNELPPATTMTDYQGHIWYATDNIFTAGDIVGDQASGTAAYIYRDAVLKVSENPLALGGDGFALPTNARTIRAMRSPIELDATFGQGNMMIGTRNSIYRIQVPTNRAAWIAATANNQPLLTLAQQKFGFLGDRALVSHNSDIFYKSMDGTRSFALALRYFNEWGNVPISRNVDRLEQFNDRSLMKYSSGIEMDNRIIFTELPYQSPVGPAFTALSVLDLDLISTIQEKRAPAWDGAWQGLDILQLFEGDFGGLQRAFAVVYARKDSTIQIWEISNSNRFENNDNRVMWVAEFPSYNWQRDNELKTLEGGDIFIDRLFGQVVIRVEYRIDSDPCWRLWHVFEQCAARSSCEDTQNPACYPAQEIPYGEQFRSSLTLPAPTIGCETMTGRPANVGYQFQVRLIITGFCRIRGILLHAIPTMKTPGEQLVC